MSPRPARHPWEPDENLDCKRCNLPRRHKVHGDPSAQPMLIDEAALRRLIRDEIDDYMRSRTCSEPSEATPTAPTSP